MGLLDLLLPPSCGGCARLGSLLCLPCRSSFRLAADPADRFFAPDAGVAVGDALEFAASAFMYEGALRRALQRLKYGHVARLAAPLAASAGSRLSEVAAHFSGAALVPVPLHPVRERERGYNQALLLARALGQRSGMPVHDLLVRGRMTTKQHKLDRAGRARNLAGAFAVARGVRGPLTVVIVDDIMTTGATLETCAAALKSAGAARVYGFTVAREV